NSNSEYKSAVGDCAHQHGCGEHEKGKPELRWLWKRRSAVTRVDLDLLGRRTAVVVALGVNQPDDRQSLAPHLAAGICQVFPRLAGPLARPPRGGAAMKA